MGHPLKHGPKNRGARRVRGEEAPEGEEQILRCLASLDATGVHKTDLTNIRKKRGYHPNTRKGGVCRGPRLGSHPKTRRTGVFWGPRVRDDSGGKAVWP